MKKIQGSKDRPRISVFRSNQYVYTQAIDDENRVTLVSASSLTLNGRKERQKIKKSEEARVVGNELAKKLKKKGIKAAVFDRGSYSYLGRVKSLAEGLREGGIEI
ncbi:50S ribosomal protein L18 [Candidatus Roizmanbacteria bacterium]|nr:50S ribosomal protein L18 [Candidatus Roizmanbacteria bacterium]